MPNEVVVTSGQVVIFVCVWGGGGGGEGEGGGVMCNRFISASKCRVAAKNISYISFISTIFAFLQIYAKLYPFFESTRQHLKTTYFL